MFTSLNNGEKGNFFEKITKEPFFVFVLSFFYKRKERNLREIIFVMIKIPLTLQIDSSVYPFKIK